MKIVFSQHSLLQIKQRGLQKSDVILTINEPDFISRSYNFREERYKRFIKNHLKVVVRIEIDLVVVITAHWVAKPKLK